MVIYLFSKQMKEFSRPVFFFFPRFQGPVGAMYKNVGECFRMHLRAASIHKIFRGLGGPRIPRRFLSATLASRSIGFDFRLVKTIQVSASGQCIVLSGVSGFGILKSPA